MAQGAHKITAEFERILAEYTGAKYAVAVDNCSNALFLSLMYVGIGGKEITIPARTYPSVPCEIIHAGGRVRFRPVEGETIKGAYRLKPTPVWDSALRFTRRMYIPGALMCLSFTGPYKRLKLGKGGAILTDSPRAVKWFKRARFSGRGELPYHDDTFKMCGWNFYMMPEIAARGILLMSEFYGKDFSDIELPYPDLSKHEAYGHNQNIRVQIGFESGRISHALPGRFNYFIKDDRR